MATPSPRNGLTRDRIVSAAVEAADHDGVESLSMRKLAASLGFEVMSLYNHVANKDDLLDAMADHVAGEIRYPDEPTDARSWQRHARLVALSARDALARHPWAAALWAVRWPGPHRFEYMDRLLGVLGAAGLPEDVADLGFHAVILHVQGFAAIAHAFSQSSAFSEDRYREAVPPGSLPHLDAHLEYHHRRGTEHDEFAFVLDLILDGLARA